VRRRNKISHPLPLQPPRRILRQRPRVPIYIALHPTRSLFQDDLRFCVHLKNKGVRDRFRRVQPIEELVDLNGKLEELDRVRVDGWDFDAERLESGRVEERFLGAVERNSGVELF